MHIEVVSITVVPYYTVITRDVPVERDCNTITVLLLLLFQINNQSINQSNVPGYEAPCCFVTDGDSNKLVAQMMTHLHSISDTAFESLKPSYESVLDKLKMLKEEWDSAEKECGLEGGETEDEVAGKNRTNPFKKLSDQLFSWLQQLPVIGFNSGKYDLNMIKRFFITLMLTPCEDQDKSCFVIKRENTFMCFSTNKVRCLDVTNFLAPGVSYEKYLKAYGCSVQKEHFPYEYIDDLNKLEEHFLPPQAAFFSRLKNEGISDPDYALCQEAWRNNRMTTMRYFLVFYNNRDVVPFLECIDQQFAFYQQQNIDMFNDGISVPGLTLLYLFNDLLPQTRSSQSLTRPTKIYITSSKTTSSVDRRSFSTDITRRMSQRYALERRVDQSWVMTPTRCTCGP